VQDETRERSTVGVAGVLIAVLTMTLAPAGSAAPVDQGTLVIATGLEPTSIKAIEAPNRYTVRIELEEPWAPFLYAVARATTWAGAGSTRTPSAPAPASSARPGSAGSPSRWCATPTTGAAGPATTWSGSSLRYVPEATMQRLLIERGELDIADTISVDALDALRQNSAVRVEVNGWPACGGAETRTMDPGGPS
jgi:ABC-type transport system substrate-binding protein